MIEMVISLGHAKCLCSACCYSALGAVSVNFKEYMKPMGVHVRLDVIQETVLLGDSKDTKESTVPVRRRKRETWDPCRLVVTRSQGL